MPIYLRALEVGDLERVHAWHNDRELYKYLGGTPHFVSQVEEKKWLEKMCEYSVKMTNLAICLAESNLHIGNIYIREIDWVSRNCELSIFIGENCNRGMGYGAAAIKQVHNHCFKDLGMSRIYLTVLKSNVRAIYVYEKLGYCVEGTMRKHVFKNGEFADLIIMGILAEDYFSLEHSQTRS